MAMCTAVYFIQKPFTADTEQLGCYYFNILQAVEFCKTLSAAIVPPIIPLCPRDNTKVEINSTDHWKSSILEIGSVSSTEVLDYTNIPIISLNEFYIRSEGKVKMKSTILEIAGLNFTSDSLSQYWILDLPPRWDTQGNDPYIFYNTLYPILPINPKITDGKVPDWYAVLSEKSFLGIHWRRGDRGNKVLGPIGRALWYSTEPIQIAKYINMYLEKNRDIEWVYVSTNSGSLIDRETLKLLVKKPIYYFDRPLNIKPLNIWKWDLVDLLLCAKSSHLILSPGGLQNSSAFGRLMYAECLKQNPDTALVQFLPMIYN
jgi:hypothetical protein